MKLMVYSIMDDGAGVFSVPFFALNDNMAIRMFGDVVGDSSTGISRHASQFHLYRVGCFDDNAGEFSNVDGTPQFIANAVDFVSIKPEVKSEADIK